MREGSNSGEALLLVFGALALELEGGSAEGFGHVLVHGEFFEVNGIDHRKKVKRDVEGEFRVVDKVSNDGVVFAKDAIGGDETKDLVGKVGHGSEGFHFLIGEARGLENGALDNFIGVADERAASLGTALNGELHALGNGHFGDLLEKCLTALDVGFRVCGGFGEMGDVGCAAMHFVQDILLVGGDGRGVFEGGGERQGITDTAKVFEQGLNADS